MNPSTSDFSIPASASARVVPWKFSSKAVLSSTRPQSDVDAPTIATRRFAMVLLLSLSVRGPVQARTARLSRRSPAAHLQARVARVEDLRVDLGRNGGGVPFGLT